jgi:RP/EB family microtubule-associated protein
LCSGEAKGVPAAVAKPKPAAPAAVKPVAAVAPAKTAISKPAPAPVKPVSTTSSKSSLNNGHHPANGNHAAKDAVNAEMQQENLRLLTEVNEMKTTLDGLEKERDFYFGKLRDIEVLCQEYEAENLPALKRILDILYATTVSLTCFLNKM